MATIEDVLGETDNTDFAIALSDLVFPRFDRDGFAGLTSEERVANCVDAVEREVNNGGFSQFFWNSSGDTSAETVTALENIGARKTADIVRRAIAAFPGGKPSPDREERQDQLDGLDGKQEEELWMGLDDEFCAYPDDLATLMRRYVEANRRGFREWTG